jgi:hypothetical protein
MNHALLYQKIPEKPQNLWFIFKIYTVSRIDQLHLINPGELAMSCLILLLIRNVLTLDTSGLRGVLLRMDFFANDICLQPKLLYRLLT